jgi:hypothetical protein
MATLGVAEEVFDPPGNVMSTRPSVSFLQSDEELFLGEVHRRGAEGRVRVEDCEDHCARKRMEGWVDKWQAFLYRRGCGTVCSYGSMDPQGTLTFMEGHICVSMDPQTRFRNFALMGPLFVWRSLSRSPDRITG